MDTKLEIHLSKTETNVGRPRTPKLYDDDDDDDDDANVCKARIVNMDWKLNQSTQF